MLNPHRSGRENGFDSFGCASQPRKDATHGRCLHSNETVCCHGRDPRHRQQGDRTRSCRDLSTARRQRLAATSSTPRQAGFHLSPEKPGDLRGWLFLAWLSKAWPQAQQQPRVLDREVATEQATRQEGFCGTSPQRLACASGLGARIGEARGSGPPSPNRFASGRAR